MLIKRNAIALFNHVFNWALPPYTRYTKTGSISINGNGTWNIDTEFRIEFVDNYTVENKISRKNVKIATQSNIAFPTLLTTNSRCYGYFDENGAIQYTLLSPGVNNSDGTFVEKDAWFGIFTTNDNTTIASFEYVLSDASPLGLQQLITGTTKISGGDFSWRLDGGNIVFDLSETIIQAAFQNKSDSPTGRRLPGYVTIPAAAAFTYNKYRKDGVLLGPATGLELNYVNGAGNLQNLTGNDASWNDFYLDTAIGTISAIQGELYTSFGNATNNANIDEPSDISPSFLQDNLFLGRLIYRRSTNINNYVGGNQNSFITFTPHN